MLKKISLVLECILLIAALITAGGCTKAKKELQNPKQETRNSANEAQKKTADSVDNRTMLTWANEDSYKKGCADCHKKTSERDVTLRAEAAKIKNHPTVPEDATVKTCLNCHNKSPEALKKLTGGLHKAHANSKYFRPKYNGSCVSCHGLKNNGEIFIKGAE